MAEAQESRLSIVIDSADAEKRIKELRKQLRELGQQSDETGDNTDDLGRRQRRASDDAGNLGSANDNARKSLDNMAKAAAIAGAALAGAIGLSINKAQSWETAMSEINKTVDFAAEDGLANMRKGLQELTTQIPQTFEELAAVTATGGQLGIAEENLLGFTETMAKMGVAFDIPAQQAADSMAKIANVFQIPIANIDRLGDAINTLSNNTPATAAQLIDSLQRVGGVAKVFGLSEDATLGLTGALIAMGKPAEVASTAVNSLLTTFSTLDNATKSQIKGFEKLGLDIDEFSKLVATDGKQAIITYLEAINKLDQSERIGTNAMIIGKEFGDDLTMLAGSVGVLESNWAMLGETANTTKEYFGSMDVEFKKISETSANKMKLFKQNIDGVVTGIGDAFIPALNDLLYTLTPLVATLSIWASENPELIKQITIIGGALLGTIVGLKLAVDGFTAMKNTVDGLKLGFAAVNNPIGLTIIALGAVLAVGVLVYQNWDKIKQVVKDNETAFALAAIAIGAVTSAILVAKAPMIFAAAQAWAMAAGATAWTGAATIAAGATWLFNAALAVLTSPILLVVGAIALIAAGGYLVVKNWAAISAGLNAEFNKIKNYVLNTVASMQAAWDRGVANTRGAIINIKNTIVTTLKELPSRMLQIGKDIVMGLVNGIKSGASGVTTAISSMASSAVAKAKSVLDIRSPSRVMRKVGEQTAEGMAKGIKKGAKAVKTEAQKMAEGAIEAVKNSIASLQKEIALFGNDSPLASFNYDVGVGKFAGVPNSLLDKNRELIAQKMRLIELDKQQAESVKLLAKARESIQERFAKLKTDQAASGKAVDGVMGELQAETAIGKIQADYERRIEVIRKHEELTTGLIGSEEAKRIAIYESAQKAKELLQIQGNEKLYGELSSITSKFFGEQSAAHRAMFAVEKYFALKRILVENKVALAKAWASASFPYNLPAVATVAAQTGLLATAVKGFKQGGYTGNIGASQVAGVVHGQEYVFDAQATKRIGVDNLNAMRSGKAVGETKVIVNNYSNEKANVQTTTDGDTIVTIGKMLDQKIDGKLSKFERDLYRQGRPLHAMR